MTVVINQRRSARIQARQKRLTATALSLFRTRGFESTTIEDITTAADVAKGTFFNYFATKHGVLSEYYAQLANEFLRLANLRRRGTTLRRLQRFFIDVEERLRAEGELMEVLFHEVFARPELMQLDAQVESAIFDIYRAALREAAGRGELRRIDVDRAARTIIDLWSSTLRVWIEQHRQFSLAGELNGKLDFLFNGLVRRSSRNRSPACDHWSSRR